MWNKFLSGAFSTILYTGIGIVLFMTGYAMLALLLRKYNLNKHIDDRNTAAGLALAGFFIAIALVVSGAIQ